MQQSPPKHVIDPLKIDQFFAQEIVQMKDDPLIVWVEELVSEVEYMVPDRNCSCHISPPCGDCEMYSGIREILENVRHYLKQRPSK